MVDLLDEIREDAGKERNHKIMMNIAIVLGIALLILIPAIMLHSWWQSKNENLVKQAAGELSASLELLDSEKFNEGQQKLKLLSEGDNIYSDIAKFHLAFLLENSHQFKSAIKYYNELSGSNNIHAELREYAQVSKLRAQIRSNNISIDKALKQITETLQASSIFSNYYNLTKISLLIHEGRSEQAGSLLRKMQNSTNMNMKYMADVLLPLTYAK